MKYGLRDISRRGANACRRRRGALSRCGVLREKYARRAGKSEITRPLRPRAVHAIIRA
jgi:hypothetical protein